MQPATSSNTSGYSYPENTDVFKQNQLKLSQNPLVQAEIEKYRYKELVDSFLNAQQIEWVDILLQCLVGYEEINKEILKVYYDEAKKHGIEVNEDDNSICLTPTINRVWAEAKNISQLAKSKGGVAVRTASTQHLIQESSSFAHEKMEDANKKGILGSLTWKKEPNKEDEIYG